MIEYLIVAAVSAAAATVVSYLFFRANPKKKAQVDEFIEKVKNDQL